MSGYIFNNIRLDNLFMFVASYNFFLIIFYKKINYCKIRNSLL